MSGFARTAELAASLVIVAVLAGCQTVQVAKVPQKQPVFIDNRNELAPIKLNRVSVKMRRGAVIGSYKFVPFTCIPRSPKVYWNQGRIRMKSMEFSDIFFEELDNANFNVVGDPDNLFAGATRDEIKPEYLVGGQIENIRMNLCDHINPFNRGQHTETQSGSASSTVTWQVFSVFNKEVVYQTKTDGSITLDQEMPDGAITLITEAFAEAAVNLAADEKLVALLKKQPSTVADITDVKHTKLRIGHLPLYETTITDNIDHIRRAVVTVETGTGHGSGFFISPGLIMTNYHVVKNTGLMKVRLITGRKVLGEVVRRHPERDVALIQVEKGGHLPLPLRMEPLKITEEVFAIGSPLYKKYAGTVTKGIVSKFRNNKYGLEDIQADVDIQGGNSGGALLDTHGNVVGVTYAGIGEYSVGMNFFIPIYDALDKLNISIEDTRGLVVKD
ncbi:MAG: trypsin-like peptidase domain-containing protein [Rhodospirillales bacterium]|nr:trypsin-like peptidase domain-containing protein [Rhodospirillales bacterium]